MKLPDANILLYTVDALSPFHDRAQEWLDGALSARESVAFTWLALVAFLRISTQARLFKSPLSIEQAFEIVDEWLAQPSAQIIHPTERHAQLILELLKPLGTAGNLVNDAHLAALAIEHGATLYSFDNDFSRFEGVRWIDPSKPARKR